MTWTFSIEKNKEFVSGLLWNPLSGTPAEEVRSAFKPSGKETQMYAAQVNADLAVWRANGDLQVGFGTGIDGAREGQYSIAAAIADQIEEDSGARNFLCAVEAPNSKWILVAQQEGVILPEGDQCGSEDPIRSAVLSYLSNGGTWDVIIAPAHWGIYNSEERTLESLLPRHRRGGIDYKKEWQLVSVKPSHKKNLLLVVAIAAVGILAYVGNQYYQDYKAAQRAAEQARLALQSQYANQPVQLTPPWHEKALAREVFSRCMAGFDEFGSFWPGNWTPISADCRNGMISAMWQRGENGWIEHLSSLRPEINISADGNVASHSISIGEVERKNNTESLPDGRMRMLEMHSNAQRYGVTVSITEAPQQVVLPGQAPADQPPPQWKELQVRIDGQGMTPEVLLEVMDGPAFRLESVMMNFNAGSIFWSMEGKQYVQP